MRKSVNPGVPLPKPVSILKPKERVDHWEVVRELGKGTFGAVYEVYNTKTKATEAMKVERRDQDEASRTLKVEITVLMELNAMKARNVCRLIGIGRKDDFTYTVMTLIGPNFEEILNRLSKASKDTPGKMTNYSAFHCGLLAMEALEDLHKAGYVHRDVKPQNFAVGLPSCPRNVYLIDFGTARMYVKSNGQLHRPRAVCGFRGTVLYASVRALQGEEQSRRDDIWSWFYILVRITTGTLPWLKMSYPSDYHKQMLAFAKAKEDAAEHPAAMLSGCPPFYKDILDTIKGLTFYSSPDYMVCCKMLRHGIEECLAAGAKPVVDWEMEAMTTAVVRSGTEQGSNVG